MNSLKFEEVNKQHQPFSHAFWHELLQPLPTYNSIELKNSETMVIFSASIAAVFRGQRLVEVQLIPVSQNQDSSIVQNTLQSLKLPESKNAFLKLFPDAYDSIGKLTHYGDEMEISALYSQNEDQPIDTVVIRFM